MGVYFLRSGSFVEWGVGVYTVRLFRGMRGGFV